jgi:hypothetical protein
VAELGQYLTVLAGALNQLPRSEMMRRPGIREGLHAMEGTIRQAYELVRSSENRSGFSRFFTAQREARQLRQVQERIQSYLSLFPVISHAHLADEVSWFQFSVIGGMRLLLSRS